MYYLQLVGDHYDFPLPFFFRCDIIMSACRDLTKKNYKREFLNLKCTGCAEVNCQGCQCKCHEIMAMVKRIKDDDD